MKKQIHRFPQITQIKIEIATLASWATVAETINAAF